MYHDISDKIIYRVSTPYNGYLVACDVVTAEKDLARFCAKLSANGGAVQSVVRIFEGAKDTPRIRVLTTPAYKNALVLELERSKRDELKAGDVVRTPRFGDVKLEEVFGNHEMLRRAGYTWPPGYEGDFEIAGKPSGQSGIKFAAAKKVPYKRHVYSMSITANTRIKRPFIDYIRLVDYDGNEYDIGWEMSEQTTKNGVYRAAFTNLVSLRNEIRKPEYFGNMRIDIVSIYDEDAANRGRFMVEKDVFAITSVTISDETGATREMTAGNGYPLVNHYYYAN